MDHMVIVLTVSARNVVSIRVMSRNAQQSCLFPSVSIFIYSHQLKVSQQGRSFKSWTGDSIRYSCWGTKILAKLSSIHLDFAKLLICVGVINVPFFPGKDGVFPGGHGVQGEGKAAAHQQRGLRHLLLPCFCHGPLGWGMTYNLFLQSVLMRWHVFFLRWWTSWGVLGTRQCGWWMARRLELRYLKFLTCSIKRWNW